MALEREKFYKDHAPMFLEYLKSVGDITDACTMAGIDDRNIEKWRKNYIEFDQAVNDAFEQFRDTLPLVLVNEAKKQLANAVFGRNAIVSTRITCRYDTNGELIDRTEVTETTAQGAQRWAIERVLDHDKAGRIEAALKVLADEGFLPRTLTERTLELIEGKREAIEELFTEYFPNTDKESQKGLSDEVVEEIKHRILGTGDQQIIDIEVES